MLLASTDVYRPAAILQLERLAHQLDIGFYPADPKKPALTLAREALEEARQSLYDVLIVDTAGRLHVDDEMMAEIRDISARGESDGNPVRGRQHGRSGCGECRACVRQLR